MKRETIIISKVNAMKPVLQVLGVGVMGKQQRPASKTGVRVQESGSTGVQFLLRSLSLSSVPWVCMPRASRPRGPRRKH